MAQSTLATIDPSANTVPPKAKGKRADIQGLRAIAVLAVIFDHLVHWPSGGFVGVDVFFVISGFLITGLLLREHDKTGTISFAGFYLRRIRRIMPAAVTVLVVTAAAAYLLFNFGRAQQTTWDAVWSLLFSANWHFAFVGTDYFQASGPVSPLQHFWSLAVEEQFYFVWPWLMLLIFWLGGRSTKWDKAKAHRAIAVAMVAIVVSSLSWAVLETASNPTMAYFSTLSRAWELGVGALIAVFASAFHGIPPAVRPVLAWVGIAGIAWSLFAITSESAFPAPWAAAPVLATALVIIAGTGGRQRFLWPLTNKVTGYVGAISYSLYLWHFPVVILLTSLLPEESPLYIPVALVLMLGLAVAAYHGIENPILKSTWLDNSEAAQKERRRRNRNKVPQSRTQKMQLIGLGVLAVVTAAVTVYAVTPTGTQTVPLAKTGSLPTSTAPAAAKDPQAVLASQVASALAADSWPELNPAIGSTGSQRVPQWTENNCISVSGENFEACVYGPLAAKKTAVVFGDSVAVSWLPAVVKALEPQGYKVQAMTMSSCPVGGVAVSNAVGSGQVYEECASHQPWALEKIKELDPDLIIMSDAPHTLRRLISKNVGDEAVAEYQKAYSETLAQLPAKSKIVTLATPPGAKDTQSCYTPLSKPADCAADLGQDWKNLRVAEEAASVEAGSVYIDTEAWFCSQGRCPAFVGKTPLYVDSLHLTAASSAMLAPVVGEALKAAKALTP
jgi:peptidoglycan/LPS O-acetylase OafA/YrhL